MTDTSNLSAGKKPYLRVYSDDDIEDKIRWLKDEVLEITAAMLQQLLNERNAILEDLKALEEDVIHGVEFVKIDLSRSETYDDTDKPD